VSHWQDIRKEREAEARKQDEALQRAIKVLQAALWVIIAEKLLDFALSGDNLKDTNRNQRQIAELIVAVQVASVSSRNKLIVAAVRGIMRMLRLNRRYFRQILPEPAATLDDLVARRVLGQYGYDRRLDRLIPGSWLDVVTDTDAIARRVAQQLSEAIRARLPLKQFVKQLKGAFLGNNGPGYVETDFRRIGRDFYASVDRTSQRIYADQAGLNHALYSGTVKNNTRDFCLERVQNIYTNDEIEKWRDLDFKGKIEVGYDPFVHCGGYNCRHHLSYLTQAMVKELGEPVNKYNGIVLA